MSYAKKISSCMILALLISCLFSTPALCGQVTGKIKVAGSQGIQILLSVLAPAPKTIIVTLRLPAGTSVASASPSYSKALAEKGIVNWLLSGVKPGQVKISCKLDRPVKPPAISASVRFRSPLTGKMEASELVR